MTEFSSPTTETARAATLAVGDEKLSRDLLMFAAALMSFAAMVWLALYWTMGTKLSTAIPFGYQVVSAVSLLIYFRTKNFAFLRLCQLTLFLFIPFMMQWAIGSFVSSSGVMLWAVMAPIGALVFWGQRESLPWIVAYLVLTAISGVFDYLLVDRPPVLPMKTVAIFFVLNFAAISTIVYFLVRHFIREQGMVRAKMQEQHSLLEAEQVRSERLLLNVLPRPIADRLKREENTIADGFADVCVMFADLVNFTRHSEEMSPSQIVTMLNQVFSTFDELAEKHGLEKIKTIGDAYMAVGGLNGQDKRDYVVATAEMAIAMREAIRGFSTVAGQQLDIRIGIATGPAVAGVIGTKKFIYDVWGDTVNLASRVQSEAAVNTISVDNTTFKRLSSRYQFTDSRTVSLKGKGEALVHRLLSRRTADVVDMTSLVGSGRNSASAA